MELGKLADYTLTRELGQGGMGKVFLAASPTGDDVALKTVVFPEGLDARARWETVERFQREARAARSLVHPNICQVLDIGADGSTFFIVLEYLDGETLRQAIQEAAGLEAEQAVRIMLRVCDALAYAHDQGIIHRDLKPDNIMLLRDGTVKLMDFGLASIVHEAGVTQTGTTMGTFPYMSPEQARGEKLDARSDIFSLGATFYEMLTGQEAFPGDGPGAIISAVLNDDPPPVTGMPPHVSRTLNRCLRKRPAYRFQTAREIIEALSFDETQLGPSRTAVLPGTTQSPASQPPKIAPGTAHTAPSAKAQQARPAPQQKPTSPGITCPKCKERIASTTASCWKCGTPNPVLAGQRQRKASQVAVDQALSGFKPPKKRGWLRWPGR